jgi:hypothetical protein
MRPLLRLQSGDRQVLEIGEAVGVIAAQSIGEPARSSRCALSISVAPRAALRSRRASKQERGTINFRVADCPQSGGSRGDES